MIKKIKQFIYNNFFTQPIMVTANQDLKGTVVIVTGASRGIGKAIATVLAQQQASLVLVARNFNELEEAYKSFNHTNLLLMSANVTDESDCKKIIENTIKQFGKVDVLINNAGLYGGGKLENFSNTMWDKMITLNINSIFLYV